MFLFESQIMRVMPIIHKKTEFYREFIGNLYFKSVEMGVSVPLLYRIEIISCSLKSHKKYTRNNGH